MVRAPARTDLIELAANLTSLALSVWEQGAIPRAGLAKPPRRSTLPARPVEVEMGNSVLQTGSFKVFDEGGRPFVIDEYAEVVEEGTLSFPGAELEGLREYRLGDEPCNAERDGSFVVVRTGQRLRRRQ